MLRATRRVLKPGGRVAFLVIAIADGLGAEQLDRALDVGPEYAAAGDGYPALLAGAGFNDVALVDVSDEYRMTQQAWIQEWDTEAAAISRLIGNKEFAERQERRRRALAGTEEGLLERWLISARR